MMCYSIEPRTRKYIKGYEFLSFARNLFVKYGEKLLDTARKTGLGPAKTASKNVVHKKVEATGEFIGNKITEKIAKPDANSRNVEEINIPPEKREETLSQLRKVLSNGTLSNI